MKCYTVNIALKKFIMSETKRISLSGLYPNYKFEVYSFNTTRFSNDSFPKGKGGVFIATRAIDPSITVGIFGVGQCDNFSLLLSNKRLLEEMTKLHPSYLLFYVSEDSEERVSIVDYILRSGNAVKRLSVFY